MKGRIGIVGIARNRRVSGFVECAQLRGFATEVVDWASLASSPSNAVRTLEQCDLVRIDSPGECARVEQLFTGTAPGFDGAIPNLASWRRGFLETMDPLRCLPHGRLLASVDDIAVAFDKRATHQRLLNAGIAQPQALAGGPFFGWSTIARALTSEGWSRCFVKPIAGSSAVGVVAISGFDPARRRISATTTMQESPGGSVCSVLHQRRVESIDELDRLIDAVGAGGLHVERWYPRAVLDGNVIDLRVLIVAGRVRHVVVRSTRGVLTNLHLGNPRGSSVDVRRRMGPAWSALVDTCVAAAAQFPSMLHVGVDVMISNRWNRVAVAEVNAFGDLLPGSFSDAGSTYESELDAIETGEWEDYRLGHGAVVA